MWTAPEAPPPPLLFPIVRDRHGPRLALVFGNQAAGGRCPFHRAGLCSHCDIGRGEGVRSDAARNLARLAWFRARYASELPSIRHLVVFNSGSTLNPAELSPGVLDAVVGFAGSLPALAELSLDTRERYVREDRVLALARALGPGRRLRATLGLESADDHVREDLLHKRMPRATVERAVAALGRARARLAPEGVGVGLAVNLLVGGPGAEGPRAASDATATARYVLALALEHGLNLDLNLEPYYPSERGAERFPAHRRPSGGEILAAARAVIGEILAAGAPAGVFIGLHDEGHDRDPTEDEARTALRAALERFHATQDPRHL